MKIIDGILLKVDNEDIINGKFEFPEGVTAIGDSAFEGCSSLKEIKIPEGVTAIGGNAFELCSSLTSINIPEGVTSIAERAFFVCRSLTSINIPEGVTSIARHAFWDCSSLTSINIPEGVTKIGDSAFEGCRSLTSINIPKGVTSIARQVFYRCSSLKEITIPEGVTRIAQYAFLECRSLKEITIPEGVTAIGDGAFKRCSSLEKIDVNRENKNLESIDGVLLQKYEEGKVLVKYPEGKKNLTSYIIPEGVIEIEDYAFEGCNSLKEISIPISVKYIGNTNFDYNNIIYDKEKKTIRLKNEEKVSKTSKYIPIPYLSYLCGEEKIESFFENTDFRAFNSNIPNLKELLSNYPSEEQLDFFKFATCLGCFNKEKIVDQNLKETEVTVGQKTSALLAKLIKTPELGLGNYHSIFDSLAYEGKASQEFLKFITPQGKNTNNLELLVRLESECPGIFAKVLTGFNEIEKYRKTLGDDGTTKTVSWEEALKKFYAETKYVGVTEETQDIAEVYSSYSLKQDIFDRGVELRKQAEKEKIPTHILGKEIRELSILEQIEEYRQKTAEELGESQQILDKLYSKKFTYEWLSKNDPRNGIMGLYASCCGTITSQAYGRQIAESSITKKDVQNLVVKDVKGKIISKGTIYIDEKHGYGVFNDFELNEKYKEHENKKEYGGRYVGDDKEESELSESQKRQREERDLIFNALQRGMKAFIEEYDKQHTDKPIQQINVGMGYNRLKRNVEQFEEATELLTVPGEYRFEDAAKQQFILYKREQKKIEVDEKKQQEEQTK